MAILPVIQDNKMKEKLKIYFNKAVTDLDPEEYTRVPSYQHTERSLTSSNLNDSSF